MDHAMRACALFVVAAISGLTCAEASALVIDDFTTAPRDLAALGETKTDAATGLSPAAVLGGARYLSVRSLTGGTGAAEVEVGDGSFRFTNASTTLSYFTLGYGDYTFNASAPPLHVDLTVGGANRFVLDVASYSNGSGSGSGTTITLWVRYGNPATTSFRSVSLGTPTPGRHEVPFADFVNVPFTDILGLGLEAGRAPAGRELILTRFAAVPEPTSLAVAASAAIGGLAVHGRRTRAARGSA
jgi:hypothetical protein